jgi:hypothetical protein
MRAAIQKKSKNLSQVHRTLVEGLLADARPVSPIHSAGSQWGLWLTASLLIMGLALALVQVQPGLSSTMSQMPSLTFVLLAFAGAALAAWEAIASSVPGRQTGRGYRVFSILVLLALFAMPVLFFTPNDHGFNPMETLREGWGCFTLVSLVGLPPWILLAWLVSRNAAFKPAWTGAWTGASAFLLGTTTVQLHCPENHWGHILMVHLMPVALFTLLASWAGLYLFSRWKR